MSDASPWAGADRLGNDEIIEEDPEADTKEGPGARNSGMPLSSSRPRTSSLPEDMKLGVLPPSNGEADNSIAVDHVIVEEDPEADTKLPGETGPSVDRRSVSDPSRPCYTRSQSEDGRAIHHHVLVTYPPSTPERFKAFYPEEQVGNGTMVFGRMAPLGGVKVKLNDQTISKKQFSLSLEPKHGKLHFVFKNLSSIKPIQLNGETLRKDESRSLTSTSHLQILDLDREGETLELMIYTDIKKQPRNYEFVVQFRSDDKWMENLTKAPVVKPDPISSPGFAEQLPLGNTWPRQNFLLLPGTGGGAQYSGTVPVQENDHLPTECSLSPSLPKKGGK